VDNVKDIEGRPGFVALQRSDEMPPRLGDSGLLGHCLLHAVLAEIGRARNYGLVHYLGGKGLANGYQGDRRRIPSTIADSGIDAAQDRVEPIRYS
jgi:hypothetical protein